jgi:hypothetical protein
MKKPRVLALVVVVVAVLGAAGCKSKEEQLAEARIELTTTEDALFREYGGSDIAAGIEKEARAAAAQATTPPAGQAVDPLTAMLGQVIGNTAREVDREMFAADCRRLGHGERVPMLTDKGRAFFARPETTTACQKIAKLADDVTRLEAELGLPPAPQ